jgi:hypothetical protein
MGNRFPRRRHHETGSVLIIVIVLLLLLAILGAAYISSARSNRIASAQTVNNSQVDLSADAISQIIQGWVLDSLNDPYGSLRGRPNQVGTYNSSNPSWYNQGDIVADSSNNLYLCLQNGVNSQPSPTAILLWREVGRLSAGPPYQTGDLVQDMSVFPPNLYVYVGATPTSTAPTSPADPSLFELANRFNVVSPMTEPWLADRSPILVDGTNPGWHFISGPIIKSIQFESPDSLALTPYRGAPGVGSGLYPGFGKLPNGTIVPILGTSPVPTTPPSLPSSSYFVAGDADGDGIADSLLFPIPGSYFDGLRWYAAVRIIDNNSAINVNTAVSRDTDFGSYVNTYNLFQSNVGFWEWFGRTTAGPIDGYKTNNISPPLTAYDDTNSTNIPIPARNDYSYVNVDDEFYHQFITRIQNPGFVNQNFRYVPIPASETAQMEYHFGQVNNANIQQVIATGTSPSVLEELQPTYFYGPSATNTFPNTPWSSTNGGVATWYARYFGGSTPGIIRPFVVANNPISNYISPVYEPGYMSNTTYPNSIDPYMLPYNTLRPGTSYSYYKGVYSPTATYQYDDVVSENGVTYISVISQNTNNDPYSSIYSPAAPKVAPDLSIWQPQPFNQNATKANVNTATFRELYRAFFSVMVGSPTSQTPFGPGVDPNPYDLGPADAINQRMFRNVLRDPTYATGGIGQNYLDGYNVLKLRAALAAVNTLGLRDAAQNIVSRSVGITAHVGGNLVPVEARVYSTAAQPYISEIYYSNYTGMNDPNDTMMQGNPKGYIAIELYNPYAFQLNISGWQLATIDRSATAPYPNLALKLLMTLNATTIGTNTIIPAHGFVILENYDPTNMTTSATNANYRPKDAFPTHGNGVIGANFVFVDSLTENVVPHELVLLRPRRSDGTYTANTSDPMNLYKEGSAATPNLPDLVPVDSYDFDGMTGSYEWHYVRTKSDGTAANVNKIFKCTYPGRYSTITQGGVTSPYRHEGTESDPVSDISPTPGLKVAAAFGQASFSSFKNNFPPIQIFNTGMPGPFPVITSAGLPQPVPESFPFGAFARNGDMLNIPYIGAYRIRLVNPQTTPVPNPLSIPPSDTTGQTFMELNSLPMDCSFADDLDSNATTPDDSTENIGRFCPMNTANNNPLNGAYTDYYSWARSLFNYLTVQAPAETYMPNVDPAFSEDSVGNAFKYWPQRPTRVPTLDPTTDATQQDGAPVEGLVNINTAPWQVLAMVPMTPIARDPMRTLNTQLAQAIVAYRNQHGPFQTLFDLNKVQGFQTAGGSFTGSPNAGDGLLAPGDAGFPGAPTGATASGASSAGIAIEDFTWDFMMLTRVSNLLTTQSDTFTVYIEVQGWQNAGVTTGANTAMPVVTRRIAFVADRSHVSPAAITHYLKTLTIPNN